MASPPLCALYPCASLSFSSNHSNLASLTMRNPSWRKTTRYHYPLTASMKKIAGKASMSSSIKIAAGASTQTSSKSWINLAFPSPLEEPHISKIAAVSSAITTAADIIGLLTTLCQGIKFLMGLSAVLKSEKKTNVEKFQHVAAALLLVAALVRHVRLILAIIRVIISV